MRPVARALKILTVLGEHSGGMTLQELADALDMPASTAYRLTTVLESEGFLIRTAKGKRFLLGSAVRSLVASTSSDYLRRVAEPVMARLNRETRETVFLTEMIGTEVVCIAVAPGTRALRFFVRLGGALPFNAAASARVILSSLDDRQVQALLDGVEFTRWTPRTIFDHGELLHHLAMVRQRGYDICDDELEDHAWAVAAPLHDLTGNVRAAVAVVAPLPTVGDASRRTELQSATLTAATEISAELGYPTPPATSVNETSGGSPS